MTPRSALGLSLCLLASGSACGDSAASPHDAGRAVAPGKDAGPPDESLAEPSTAAALRDAYRASVQANELSLAPSPCPAGDSPGVSCFKTTVPLSWQQPILGLIGLFARRFEADGEPLRQLWLLGDGPGSPSAALQARARAAVQAWPGTEVWLLDYRGVGRSERLACPSEQDSGGRLSDLLPPNDAAAARIERCFRESRIRWANDIFLFSLTETAADLAGLVQATRVSELQVSIYGVGWGSRVAHDFLQLFPRAVDSVVLDSFGLPGTLGDRDGSSDAALRGLLRACAVDSACAERLGDDPVGFAQQVLAGLEAGGCPALDAQELDATALRGLLGSLLEVRALWPFVPVALHRAGRCDASDVAALVTLRDSLDAESVTDPDAQPSDALRLLQLRALAPEQTTAAWSSREPELLALDDAPRLIASYAESIPVRPANALRGVWADSDVPMLILQGALDPHAPPDNGTQAASHFAGESRHLLNVPAHGAGFGLDDACGQGLVRSFLEDSARTPDAACLDAVGIDFSLDPREASARLGDSSGWGE